MSLAGLHNLVSLPFLLPSFPVQDRAIKRRRPLLKLVVKIPPGGTDKREITKLWRPVE